MEDIYKYLMESSYPLSDIPRSLVLPPTLQKICSASLPVHVHKDGIPDKRNTISNVREPMLAANLLPKN